MYAVFLQQPFAQTKDSMDIYSETLSDTAGINRLINYCFNKRNGQTEKCIQFSKLTLEKSTKINFKLGEARSINNLGVMESIKGNYPAARQYCNNLLWYCSR